MEGQAILVLSRKAKQRIVIGENIELVVVAVNGDHVKVGFNAPNDVPIHREEVHQNIHAESGAAEVGWHQGERNQTGITGRLLRASHS